MSRGLGNLQREVKTIIAEYDDWFFSVYITFGEPVEESPWLSWPIIRNLYFQQRGLAFDSTSLRYVHASLERSLKRALKTLVDRGEVRRIPSPSGRGWHYTTPERLQQYEQSVEMKPARRFGRKR
jgi:hypothetical protein